MLVAGGAGLPGRHAVGEPGRDHRRAGHAAAGHRRGLRPPRTAAGDAIKAGGRRGAAPPAGVPHVVQSAGNMFSRLLHRRRPGRATSPAPAARTPAAYAAFFHAMLDRGRLPAAVGVRGVVPLRRPRRAGGADRPRRAARSRARPPPEPEETDERHRPPSTCCATARCTTRRASSTAAATATTSPTAAGDGRAGRRRRSATATSPTSSPRRSSAPRRPRAPLAAARGLEIATDERVIESTTSSRASASASATARCAGRRPGGTCWNPFKPSWGEPYKEVVARMMAAVARRPRRGRAATRRCSSPTSCRSGSPGCTPRSGRSCTTRASASARCAR